MLDGPQVGSASEAKGAPRRVALIVGNYVNVVDGVALTYGRVVRERLLAGDQLLVLGPGPARGRRARVEPGGAFLELPSLAVPVQPEYRVALGLPPAVRRRLEAFEPELIHVASPDLAGAAALDFAAAHGIPAVAAYHSEIAGYLRYLPGPALLGRALERGVWRWIAEFYGRCRRVYVPTASTLEDLRRRGIDTQLELWGRGVDLERFSPRWRSPSWRRRVGVPAEDSDCPVVLFAARLRWEKGLDVLAEVLATLERRGLRHRAVIVGDGPGRASLRRRLRGARLLGELEVGALAEAFASSDLFLYPSPTETFGNVTLEAMASGLPCLCADAPGSRSLVLAGETGELAPAGSVEAFVELAAALLADPARRRRLGAAARRRAEGYAWSAACARLGDLWADALGQS